MTLALLVGCADTVTVSLSFPSEAHFVNSTSAEIAAVRVGPNQGDLCPSVTERVAFRVLQEANEYTGTLPVCSFRAGVVIPGVDSGTRLIIAVTRAVDDSPLLTGCTAQDLVDDPTTVRIVLNETDYYRALFPAGSGSTCSANQKCEQGCL